MKLNQGSALLVGRSGVHGHGGPTPPLSVYLCDALLCPHLFWPASEAPPSEGPPQHPAKHHPDPDWWPGPGTGWVQHTYRLTLLFLQLMKLLISLLHTEIQHQGCNIGPPISCLCICFYFSRCWCIAAPQCDYYTFWIQIFKCVMPTVSPSVLHPLFQQHSLFLKSTGLLCPQLAGRGAPWPRCIPNSPWFHSLYKLPVPGPCRLVATPSLQVYILRSSRYHA